CRRSASLCERLRAEGLEPMVRARTGLVLDAYFSGTKIAWLLDARPELRARAARGELAFGTVDTWLLWQLTGGRVHATEPSNASRTLCFDIRRLDWDAELTNHLRIPREGFPAVRASVGVVGERPAPCPASPGTSRPRSLARAHSPRGARRTRTARAAFSSSTRGPSPSPRKPASSRPSRGPCRSPRANRPPSCMRWRARS